MWPNNKTERDFLYFSGMSDTVAEIVVQARGRPISISVSSAWCIVKRKLPAPAFSELVAAAPQLPTWLGRSVGKVAYG